MLRTGLSKLHTVSSSGSAMRVHNALPCLRQCLAFGIHERLWLTSADAIHYPTWVCGSVGFFLGSSFALMHRALTARVWVKPKVPLNVVITGGTRGIGKALVREFLRTGDNVYIAARSQRGIREAMAELDADCTHKRQLAGTDCDVSSPSAVARLASLATDHFEDRTIDVWINNAGVRLVWYDSEHSVTMSSPLAGANLSVQSTSGGHCQQNAPHRNASASNCHHRCTAHHPTRMLCRCQRQLQALPRALSR